MIIFFFKFSIWWIICVSVWIPFYDVVLNYWQNCLFAHLEPAWIRHYTMISQNEQAWKYVVQRIMFNFTWYFGKPQCYSKSNRHFIRSEKFPLEKPIPNKHSGCTESNGKNDVKLWQPIVGAMNRESKKTVINITNPQRNSLAAVRCSLRQLFMFVQNSMDTNAVDDITHTNTHTQIESIQICCSQSYWAWATKREKLKFFLFGFFMVWFCGIWLSTFIFIIRRIQIGFCAMNFAQLFF